MGNRTFAGLIVSVLLSTTVTSNVAAEPTDGLAPAAAELETRERSLERGAVELKKLNALGIKTLAQMASASPRKVASVVGAARAEKLISQSKHATRSTGIVALTWIIDPDYIVDSTFIIDPDYRTDSRAVQRRNAGAAQLKQLQKAGVGTFAKLILRANKAKVVVVVGAVRAEGLINGAKKALNIGIIDPDYLVDSSFVVDPMIIAKAK